MVLSRSFLHQLGHSCSPGSPRDPQTQLLRLAGEVPAPIKWKKRWEDSPTPRGRSEWEPQEMQLPMNTTGPRNGQGHPPRVRLLPLYSQEMKLSINPWLDIGSRNFRTEPGCLRVWRGELGVNTTMGMCSGIATLGVTCQVRLQVLEPWLGTAASFLWDCTVFPSKPHSQEIPRT